MKNLPAMQESQVRSLGRERSAGEGKGYPLQYSCLENFVNTPMDRAPLHGPAPLSSQGGATAREQESDCRDRCQPLAALEAVLMALLWCLVLGRKPRTFPGGPEIRIWRFHCRGWRGAPAPSWVGVPRSHRHHSATKKNTPRRFLFFMI